jgi:hypothetical protein
LSLYEQMTANTAQKPKEKGQSPFESARTKSSTKSAKSSTQAAPKPPKAEKAAAEAKPAFQRIPKVQREKKPKAEKAVKAPEAPKAPKEPTEKKEVCVWGVRAPPAREACGQVEAALQALRSGLGLPVADEPEPLAYVQTRSAGSCVHSWTVVERERERERYMSWWAHTGGGTALAIKAPPMRPADAIS